MNGNYSVYVKTSIFPFITDINSSAFLRDTAGWTKIDEGFGDNCRHAQNNYFPLPVITEGGAYRYKLVNGVPAECTAEEIAGQEAANLPGSAVPTLENRVETLETSSAEMSEALEMILSGVTE